MNQKLTAILIIMAVAALIVGAVVAVAILVIPSIGTIVITPIEDMDGNPATLDWGNNIQANQTVSRTVTITNTGTASTTPLHFTHSLNASLGTISWNQEGTVVPAAATITAIFTLTASASPPLGVFNADLTITG